MRDSLKKLKPETAIQFRNVVKLKMESSGTNGPITGANGTHGSVNWTFLLEYFLRDEHSAPKSRCLMFVNPPAGVISTKISGTVFGA